MEDLQKEELETTERSHNYNIHSVVNDHISGNARRAKNKAKSWKYGYDSDYDLVVISKDGTVGDIYEINGLYIGLPETPKEIINTDNRWIPSEFPKELQRIKSSFE